MSCKLDENLLYAYSDGTIEVLEKIFVEEHIKYCDECKNQLQFISIIDGSLSNLNNDIIIPNRLSLISELIVENCLNAVENENSKLRRHNYFEDMKAVRNLILKSQKLGYTNVVNSYVETSIKKTADTFGKSLGNFVKKKLSKIDLRKLLKVG